MADNPMLKFTTVTRDMPEKRPPDLRAHDFREIYAEYAGAKAESRPAGVASAACLIARAIAPCTTTSPTGCV